MGDPRIALACDAMRRFLARGRRYLWTDAFAVCNCLGLARATGDASWEALAIELVERVHEELGRHRTDDDRRGWISGLPEGEGRAHPTAGGLRIGKPLSERAPEQTFDPDLEWERDGQYFHYLTKWMHALDQVARTTGRAAFHLWARELADAAHRGFVRGAGERRRMVWKTSIDRSRVLVPSAGQHDPLDGLVTCRQLDATARALSLDDPRPGLARAAADFEELLDRASLETDDPLGLGGLLCDASRLAQLAVEPDLLAALVVAAEEGLRAIVAGRELDGPVHRRLAFRELGLAIGLAAVARFDDDPRFSRIARFASLRGEIERTWCAEDARRTALWREHEDIDDVMLATSLVPDGFVVLAPPLTSATDSRRMAPPA